MTTELAVFQTDQDLGESADYLDDPNYPEPYGSMYRSLAVDLQEELSRAFPTMDTLNAILAKEMARLRVISVAADRGVEGMSVHRDTRALLSTSKDLITRLSKVQDALAAEVVVAFVEKYIIPAFSHVLMDTYEEGSPEWLEEDGIARIIHQAQTDALVSATKQFAEDHPYLR